MKVLKFGGSSVGSVPAITNALSIVANASTFGEIVVVVSALQGVTNELIRSSELALSKNEDWRALLSNLESRHLATLDALVPSQEYARHVGPLKILFREVSEILLGVSLLGERTAKTLDAVMSYGERASSILFAGALSSHSPGKLLGSAVDASKFLYTTEAFGNAQPLGEKTYRSIRNSLQSVLTQSDRVKTIPVVTGFLGVTELGETTTLGRGGSDYTGALCAAALEATSLEIWTDVDGVMTADPRKVPNALALPHLTYAEALELCHFGAKVIYAPTMRPIIEKRIPLWIKNTFNPEVPGTLIDDSRTPRETLITATSSIDRVALLRVEGSGMVGVPGTSMRLFGALARAQVNVILVSQASSEHTVCVAIPPHQADTACKALNEEFFFEQKLGTIDEIVIDNDYSIVSIVGENMRNRPGISGRLFQALGRNGVNIAAIAQGSSELNISTVIHRTQEVKALNVIHDRFFRSHVRTINLFLVGVGLIGKTLLRQIAHHKEQLARDHHIDLRLVGLCSRKGFVIDERGLDAQKFKEILESSEPGEIDEFVSQMKQLNLPHTVFVDCTASDDVARKYEEILRAHLSIVTPNKRAQSGPLNLYKRLASLSSNLGARLLYETSVGAGLPIIGTLNDLRKSGDQIIKIEAVLSGTLSYLFNTFTSSHSFSTLVKDALSLGFTEPDPRDDLCGSDVGRKILILGREAGASLETTDVVVENLVPERARNASSIDVFWEELAHHDDAMNQRVLEAEKQNRRLTYCSVFEEGRAHASLQMLPHTHPFASLSGSDNIVAFTTERYRERPLVIKGPGAGAEVTAAGVFADIVRLAQIEL
jgi:bifunctional aspartokinase / homoserine dehydrogenase 1